MQKPNALTPQQTIALEEEGRAIADTLQSLLPESTMLKQLPDSHLQWAVFWRDGECGGFMWSEGLWIRTEPGDPENRRFYQFFNVAPENVRSDVREAVKVALNKHRIKAMYQGYRNPLTAA